jgi:hypothetical protein
MSEAPPVMILDGLSADARKWLEETAASMEAEFRKQEPEAVVTAENLACRIIEHYVANEIEVAE